MKTRKVSRRVGEDREYHEESTFVHSVMLNETDQNQMPENRVPCPALLGGKKLAGDPIN